MGWSDAARVLREVLPGSRAELRELLGALGVRARREESGSARRKSGTPELVRRTLDGAGVSSPRSLSTPRDGELEREPDEGVLEREPEGAGAAERELPREPEGEGVAERELPAGAGEGVAEREPPLEGAGDGVAERELPRELEGEGVAEREPPEGAGEGVDERDPPDGIERDPPDGEGEEDREPPEGTEGDDPPDERLPDPPDEPLRPIARWASEGVARSKMPIKERAQNETREIKRMFTPRSESQARAVKDNRPTAIYCITLGPRTDSSHFADGHNKPNSPAHDCPCDLRSWPPSRAIAGVRQISGSPELKPAASVSKAWERPLTSSFRGGCCPGHR